MNLARLASLGLLSSLALACSDDDDGTPPPFIAGIGADAGTVTVSDLDSDQKARLCQSYGAHVSGRVGYDLLAEAVCLPQAILLGGSPQGCQERLAACSADIPPPLQINLQVSDTHVCEQSLAQCQLSSAQLEGCINLRLDWVYALLDTLSCRGASDPDTHSLAEQMMRGVGVCAAGSAGCDRFINVDPEPVLF
jgi:hypothetical protein